MALSSLVLKKASVKVTLSSINSMFMKICQSEQKHFYKFSDTKYWRHAKLQDMSDNT